MCAAFKNLTHLFTINYDRHPYYKSARRYDASECLLDLNNQFEYLKPTSDILNRHSNENKIA